MILALSRRVQAGARKRLVRISFANAMGFGFTTGQTIYLIALMFGANDMQMGLLYAAPFVTTLAALFVPALLNHHETTAIWSRFWWLRTLLCLGYFGLPWMTDADARVWMFILIHYLFMISRAFGLSGYFTVLRAVASPRENAALMARNLMSAQFGVLLAQSLAFGVLTLNLIGSESRNLMSLLVIGMIANGITARMIGRLPRTGYLQEGSMRGLARTARAMSREATYREVALATAFQAATAVFAGYLISYLRQIAGFRSGDIFLFTVIGLFAAIFISNLQRVIGARVRERILLLASHAALALVGLAWALIRLCPLLEGNRAAAAGLYGLTVLFLTAAATVALQLRTGRLPRHHSVEHSIVYDMAQVIGAVLAIGLARLAVAAPVATGLHAYSLVFALWTATSLSVCLLATRMRSDSDGGLRQEFAALLPSSIFTIIRAHRLDQDDNLIRRQLALEGLLQAPNPVSREMILEHLRSPDVGMRRSCIRVLMGYPMDAAVPLLLDEAASPFSPLREDAISALGFSGRADLAPVLWQGWKTAPADVRAVLAKSLLRLGEPVPDGVLRGVWAECSRSRRVDLLIGLAASRRTGLLLALLADVWTERPDSYYTRLVLGIAAATAGWRESMHDVFSEEDQHPGRGWDDILANTETPWPEGLPLEDARRAIEREDYEALTTLLRTVCDEPWVLAYDRTTALGILFLVLLRIHGELADPPDRPEPQAD